MSPPALLVDGRVLDDDHPGVQRFWLPVLTAWAARGNCGAVAYQRGGMPQPTLVAAGFRPIAVHYGARHPLAAWSNRRVVERIRVRAALSPLYLTLSGAPRSLATVFDVTGRTHPRSRGSRVLWEMAMWQTLRTASVIVCATAAAAHELEAAFPRARGRTAIVPAIAPPPAQPNDSLLARWHLPAPFALAIGSHRPHKRLSELARYWGAAEGNLALVLAGSGTVALHAPPRVHGLGFVSDETIDALLARAACLISASVAEGFGLPVLAALSAGVPVVATRQAALVEVADDGAQWCATNDLAGLVRAAATLARDRAAAAPLIARGHNQAQRFTVERAVGELERLVEE